MFAPHLDAKTDRALIAHAPQVTGVVLSVTEHIVLNLQRSFQNQWKIRHVTLCHESAFFTHAGQEVSIIR